MPPLTLKARTAETYLAGIGATGALIASAFVGFMLLVGAVTFDSWPRVPALLEGGNGNISVSEPTPQAVNPEPPGVPNLGGIIARRAAATAVARASGSREGISGVPRGQGTLDTGTSPIPGSPVEEPPPVSQPEPPAGEGPTGVVPKTVSSVGNTVEGTTDGVGDLVSNNVSPGLGGVVNGLGHAVNGTVQKLVGGQGH